MHTSYRFYKNGNDEQLNSKKYYFNYFFKIRCCCTSHSNRASFSFRVWMHLIQCMISIARNRNGSKTNKLSDDSDSIKTIT